MQQVPREILFQIAQELYSWEFRPLCYTCKEYAGGIKFYWAAHAALLGIKSEVSGEIDCKFYYYDRLRDKNTTKNAAQLYQLKRHLGASEEIFMGYFPYEVRGLIGRLMEAKLNIDFKVDSLTFEVLNPDVPVIIACNSRHTNIRINGVLFETSGGKLKRKTTYTDPNHVVSATPQTKLYWDFMCILDRWIKGRNY